MKKIVLLAVLALVLVAVPAFASVQNVKVSGDINSTWVARNQFDLGNSTAAGRGGTNEQNFFMTQTFLRVDADLTDKVSATVRLLNETPWDQASDSNQGVDLNLAYVTVKEMLYSPLTMVVGRQAFAFGNSFVISSEGPNNAVGVGGLNGVAEDLSWSRAMDAVRATLDYNPLTIDFVGAKIDANNLQGVEALKDDVTLYGANANYKLGDKNDTVIEGYLWAKYDDSGSGTAGSKTDTVYMPGVRAQANLLDGLMLSGEAAMQRGTKNMASVGLSGNDNRERSAFALQGISSYALPFEKTKAYSPVLTAAYTYLSGDEGTATKSTNKSYKAWDPMFENQGGGTIYNTLFNLTNCNIVTVKGSIKPIEDVTASMEWNSLWMPQYNSTLVINQPDGTTISQGVNSDTDKTGLGNEIDFNLAYAYTEDVTIGATLGRFITGDAFAGENRKDATQAMVNMDVKF